MQLHECAYTLFRIEQVSGRPPSPPLVRLTTNNSRRTFTYLAQHVVPLVHTRVDHRRRRNMSDSSLFRRTVLNLLTTIQDFQPSNKTSFAACTAAYVRGQLVSLLHHLTPRAKQRLPLSRSDTNSPAASPTSHLRRRRSTLRLRRRLHNGLARLRCHILLTHLRNTSCRRVTSDLSMDGGTISGTMRQLQRGVSNLLWRER